MSCASARADALLVACIALVACQDPANAPVPLTIVSEPAAQTAGGIITLTSDQFSGLRLLPSPDTTQPNRWTNFAVIVGADTAESWRVGPTQIAFRVPPVRTGNYQASISARGYDSVQIAFFAVGLAFPVYWAGLNPYTNVSTGTLLPARGLLIAEETSWPGFTTGYGLVDVQTQTLRMVPELRQGGSNRVKMYAPDPAIAPIISYSICHPSEAPPRPCGEPIRGRWWIRFHAVTPAAFIPLRSYRPLCA